MQFIIEGMNMGEVQDFEKEKLVIGVLISRPEFLESLKGQLVQQWGPLDFETELMPFDFTDYYNREMGTPIYRCFFSFQDLVCPEDLPGIKLQTNDMEKEFADNEGRKVNLDPGILSLSKFILATTKNNVHRIPMSRGIYGELTLQFKDRDFHPLDWTYPDFKSRANRDILIAIRDHYKQQRKTL